MAEENIIGIIGLPSAGKTTLVNSIIGKRILHTGVCRTTTNVHLIGHSNVFEFPPERYHKHTIKDDDGNKFMFLDLPGISDAENKGKEQNFDELTKAWITRCNIILWITDISTAFLTTHEKQEFDKINSMLQKLTRETGTLYQVAIVLSKYNFDEKEQIIKKSTNVTIKTSDETSDEISDENEDTTIADCYKRVEKLFANTNIPLIRFNAFGRIKYGDKIGVQLKKLVDSSATPKKCYIDFSIKWAIADLYNKQQLSLVDCLLNHIFVNDLLPKCSKGIIDDFYCISNGLGGYCACKSPCMCKCVEHGRCQFNALKVDKVCSGGTLCKYHNNENKCPYGKNLSEYCGNWKTCTLHYKYNYSKNIETFNKITNKTILEQILKFMLITSQDELNIYKKTYNSIDKIQNYDVNKWDNFSLKIGDNKILEEIFNTYTKNNITNGNIVYRLINMIGVNNINVTKLYINLLKTHSNSVNQYFNLHSKTTLKEITRYVPKICEHDIEYTKNREIGCSNEWKNKIKAIRKSLWGDKESNIDINMLLMNVWHGNTPSIFSDIIC